MLGLKTVLFATDFSALADAALDRALELAERHGAALHMLHAVVLHAEDPNDPAHHFPDAEEIRLRLEAIAADRMTAQLEARQELEIEVVRAQRRGVAPGPVILEYAAGIDADLIVMGTHGRRGLSHAILGSVTEEVVRLADCPVLTVSGTVDPGSSLGLGAVLVPVDFSAHSTRAVRYAAEICRSYGAVMHLVHVFETPIHPEVYLGGGPSYPTFQQVEEGLRPALSEFAARAGAPADTSVHLREGRAVSGIVEAADELGADLIVIATHGLTGLKHVLLGSVAERVVRRARCPVLTVKAFGKSIVDE